MARYRVLKGIDYPPNKRAEIGDVVDDLPANAVKWLLADEIIEDADKPSKVKAEPVPAPVIEPVVAEPIIKEPIIEVPVEESKEDGFNPDAKDEDNDGLVQDGTPFQRPVEEK